MPFEADFVCMRAQVVRFAGLIGMPEPLPPVMQPHIHKRDIRPRTEKQDKLDSEAFLRVLGDGPLLAP